MKRINPFDKIYAGEHLNFLEKTTHDFPSFIDLELTNHCNLDCIMCNRRLMTREKGNMARELFNKIIEQCTKHKTPIRFIRWGEPFLHPFIFDYINIVKEKGLLLHITTNGLLLDDFKLQKLIDSNLDSIIFSMQGFTKEVYNEMRLNDRYNHLLHLINKLIELRGEKSSPYIQITTTVTAEQDNKKDRLCFSDYWKNKVDLVKIGKTNMARFNNTERGVYQPCWEVFNHMSIDWDGKVTPCCGDYDNYLTIGDANDLPLHEIWRYNSRLNGIRLMLGNNMHRSLTLCSKCFPAYDMKCKE